MNADIAVNDGTIVRVAPDLPEDDAATVDRRPRPAGLPRRRRRPPALGHLQPAAQDTGTESRRRAQGGVTTALTYMRTGQYYLNKGGSYDDFFPEVLRVGGPGLHRLRLPPGAHDAPSTSTRSRPRRGVRRHLVQDLHVLRQPRAARPVDRQSDFLMIPEDERYDLAHFEFVMRGCRRPGRSSPSWRRPLVAVAALRDRRDHDAYTKLVSRRARSPACAPTAPPARSTPRASPSRSPPTWRTRRACRTSTCCTCPRARPWTAACHGRGVPARRLPPRGDHRPPARRRRHRHRHRRQGQPADAARARTSRRCGSTSSTARRLGGQRPRLLP